MKVLHINTTDTIGGAAIAAFRLHTAMLKNGIDSTYFVLCRTVNDRSDIRTVSKYDRHVKRNIHRILEKIAAKGFNPQRGFYSTFCFGVDVSRYAEFRESDIIYLHWVCRSFINWRILKKILKTGKPVFWFMHDMFPITGGCHYAFDCTKYYTGCSKCPFYANHAILPDIPAWQFSMKRKIYQQFNNLGFIAPSQWLTDCAQKSALTRDKPIYHIPNLIDPERFKEMDKNAARSLFSLNSKRKVIAFGADNALSNPYKGWNYFRDALHILAKKPMIKDTAIEVIIFGSSYNKAIADDIPFPVHFLGQLHDEFSMVMMYNCADVFVIPSLAESFGQTILESLSCNISVVGFHVGGIPDMVNEHTGYLAKYKDSSDLAEGIACLITTGKKDVRSYVERFFSNEILKKHESLSNSVITAPP